METQANATPLRVYWRPGCSSCVRVKEFLSKLGVDYESINVSARPEAMGELAEMGVRTVPVVARGKEYVFAQELADVSTFIGRKVDFKRLPAPELMDKWFRVLGVAQRLVMQIPPARWEERATEGRDRSVKALAYHIFQVPDAFLQCLLDGNEQMAITYNEPVPPKVKTVADVRDYGARIEKRLQSWWASNADKQAAGTITTYYGVQPLHHVLERCTWHSAQHTRQILSVLEKFGVKPDIRLTDKDYAGLPMPEGLWE
jgi:glutaredoxin